MSVSSFTSLSRDNLIRFINSPDFFTRNPALQDQEAAVQECKQAYAISKRNSSCSCGGNTKLLTPCLEGLLNKLESLKETDPGAITAFVQYVTGQTAGEQRINVTVYYTKNNGTAPYRYEFIA